MSTSHSNARHAIAKMEPFQGHGSMSGFTYGEWGSGRLSGEALNAWQRDLPKLDYVVYSYATPIAWHTPERGWVDVRQSFSVTTSKQQGHARSGIHMSDDSRIEEVGYRVPLSDPQYDLLTQLGSNPREVKGQEVRTAAVLERHGLADAIRYPSGTVWLTITDAGLKRI
jgi:hypothetical protein